jgi:single-strand DNA-binding protein
MMAALKRCERARRERMSGEPTITVIGRIGNDPDFKVDGEGRGRALFNVGCTPVNKENYNAEKKDTMWFSVTVWKNAEELIDIATKGALIMVSGKLNIRSWEDKDGKERQTWQITADHAGIVPSKSKKKSEEEPEW